MDYNQLFAIAATGLDAQRLRIQAATLNLANADTVLLPGGARATGTKGTMDGSAAPGVSGADGWQPLRAVVRAVPGDPTGFGGVFDSLARLPEARLEPSGVAPRRVHDPAHPAADGSGFVSYPGVDSVTERLTMLAAARAYEANLAAMMLGRGLALKTLDIGGR